MLPNPTAIATSTRHLQVVHVIRASMQAHRFVLAHDQFADGVTLLQLPGRILVRLQRLQDLAWEELRVHLDAVDS